MTIRARPVPAKWLACFWVGMLFVVVACAPQSTPTPPPPTITPTAIPTNTPLFTATPAPTDTPMPTPTPTLIPFVEMDATAQADALGRGMNFGNMLEAPNEGDWGLTLQPEYFDLVKNAGFRTVRLPIRWSSHTDTKPPYTIDPKFFERIDWAIQQATSRGLNIVVNVHHYQELMTNTEAERPRFYAMWKQIAERYKEQPSSVLFELYNEPNTITDKMWNTIAAETLAVVRQSNPTRNVIIGGVDYNSVNGLLGLRLPADDPHIIATFHYYLPFEFTHQGADWVNGSDAWLGTKWGTSNDKTEVDYDIYRVKEWADKYKRPLWLGEFGAYREADMDSRVKWTAYLAREMEKKKINWAYWDFAADFAAYDHTQNKWIEPLLDALMPQ